MTTISLIAALLAAAGALILPFAWGMAVLVVCLPVANVYAGAVAVAMLLGRWAVTDLPRLSTSRHSAAVAISVLAFLVLSLAFSAVVSSNLSRLASESAQWILAVGLFLALVLSNSEELQRIVVRALAFGAAVLAVLQIVLVMMELRPEEGSAAPVLASTSNYASILVLFGLVVLPIAYRGVVNHRWRLPMFILAVVNIHLNESRASLATALGVIVIWLLVSIRDIRLVVAVGALSCGGAAVVLSTLLSVALYDPLSVLSLGNFENNFSNLERLGLLAYSWELFLANPMGTGVGSSSDIFMDNPYTVGSYPHAHNSLAMLGVEFGWLGVVAYLAMNWVLVVDIWSRFSRWDAAGLLATAMLLVLLYDSLFFNGVLAMYFWLLLALVIMRRQSEKTLVTLKLALERC